MPRFRALHLARPAAALLICLPLLSCSKDDAGCQLRIDADGERFLLCADGSRLSLEPLPKPELPVGIARSEARLFGRDDHSSITVLMRRTDGGWTTSTAVNPDGTWELEMPAGIYDVEYNAPSYEGANAKSVLVAPGLTHPDPVELRARISLNDNAPERMMVLPDESGLVMLDGEPGELWVWTFGGATSSLSGSAGQVSFTPSRNRVAYLDKFVPGPQTGDLVFFAPASLTFTRVAEGVSRWKMSADETVVAAELTDSTLVVWREGEGVSIVTDDAFEWDLSPSGRTLLFWTRIPGGGFMLIHWDVAAEGGSALSASMRPFVFSPDGESFIYYDMFGEAVLWDGLRHRTVHLGEPSGEPPVFGPDGQWLVFPSLGEGALLFDLASPVPARLPGAPDFWLFSDQGDELYFGSTKDGAASLKRLDLERGSTTDITDGAGISVPLFAGDEQERWLVFAFLPEEGAAPQLLGWTRARGLVVLSERPDQAWSSWSIAPGGGSVAFYEDGGLVTVELSTRARSVADGAARLEFVPSWRGPEVVLFARPDETFAVHDRIRGSTTSLGDAVDLPTCSSEPDGSTSCLAHASPNGGGSQLVRWDRASDRAGLTTDGILESRSCKDGSRLALRSRALPATDENLLVIFDPTLGGPVPVDDRVIDWVIAPRWVAWIRDEGEDDQRVYYTAYPAEPH